MDSSDSEDDCYGNIAQRLQSMKNKYTEDRIESTNILNDSLELDEVIKNNNGKPLKDKTDTGNIINDDGFAVDDSNEAIIDSLIATSTKRVTRLAVKRNSAQVSLEKSTPTKPNKKKKTVRNSSTTCSQSSTCATATVTNHATATMTNCATATLTNPTSHDSGSSRGRGRGRGRNRTRTRNVINHISNRDIVTYSVGNTDEYPDQLDNVALFSEPKSQDVCLIEETELDENEELSVKVYWQSSDIFKFTIRKFQKIVQIFDFFSKKENISIDKLLLTFNEKILKPDDTPESINYNIAKFIDGGIVNQSVSKLVTDKSNDKIKDGIKLKFQCQNLKKPFELTVCLDEKLSIAMMKYAEHIETSLDKLKFEFDGDLLSGKSTAREMDFEGGECIDVKIIH